jgi:hypothetical protein
MHIFPLAPTVWSNKSACAGAREMSAVISCVGQEGIATPSTALAGSKQVIAPIHCLESSRAHLQVRDRVAMQARPRDN